MPYFDHCATTPLDPLALEALLPWLNEHYGNPSSMHRYGRSARAAIDVARQQVAEFVDAQPAQLIFTPSGTTANNLAVTGYLGHSTQRRFWVSRVEHASVQKIADSLAPERVSWLDTDAQGIIQLDREVLKSAQASDLLALMLANNETGVIEPVAELAKVAEEYGLRIHSDAVQAAGKTELSFRQLGVDSMTICSHKLYGPLGAAALVVKNCADLDPIVYGGAHERGLFSGTENTAAIVGFGVACQLAGQQLEIRRQRITRLQNRLEKGLVEDFGATIFAASAQRLPGVTMFALSGLHGELLVMYLDRARFAASSGSACHSTANRPSPVLRSMGVADDTALASVRVSLGKDNTEQEVDDFLSHLRKIVDELVLD